MKNEKGITLISLIVYIILLTLAVAGISNIMGAMHSNVNSMDKASESAVSLSRFNMHFIKDIKRDDVKIVSSTSDQVQLSFTNDAGENEIVKYSIQNNALYRNKVKICSNVNAGTITANEDTGVIQVYLKINNYEKITKYVLEPKNSEKIII